MRIRRRHIGRRLRALGEAWSEHVDDLFVIAGVGFLMRGAWLVYPPLMYLLAGVMLLGGAWFLGRLR